MFWELQVRKALDMIKLVAEKAQAARKRILREDGKKDGEEPPADAGDEDEAPFDREALEEDAKKYETLWTEFGKALKLGAQLPAMGACAVHATHPV